MSGAYKFKTKRIKVPDCDCDITLVFPSKKQITIQCRPSNADEGYNGSLDILLPDNANVVCWKGDDMEAAPARHPNYPHARYAKHLLVELP
jgi:hypothetical protein